MLEGPEAESAMRVLLPAVNRYGGSKKHVAEAVRLLESNTPSEYIIDIAKSNGFGYQTRGLAGLPFGVRLALEMSSHEEAERRALQEGELAALEEEWKRAEEIASISDEMFMPQSLMEKLNSWRR